MDKETKYIIAGIVVVVLFLMFKDRIKTAIAPNGPAVNISSGQSTKPLPAPIATAQKNMDK